MKIVLLNSAIVLSMDNGNDKINACSKDEECVAGIVGCWRWVPVNRKNVRKETGAFGGYYINGGSIDCVKSHDPGPRPKVECRGGECVATKKTDPVPEVACNQDSDCELIKYDCNQASAANHAHILQVREKICQCHDCVTTDCSEFNPHEMRAVCQNHYECGVQYTKGVVYYSQAERDSRPDPRGEKWNKRFMGKTYILNAVSSRRIKPRPDKDKFHCFQGTFHR